MCVREFACVGQANHAYIYKSPNDRKWPLFDLHVNGSHVKLVFKQQNTEIYY